MHLKYICCMIIGLSEQFRHSWKMKVKAMATITVPNACQDCEWGHN